MTKLRLILLTSSLFFLSCEAPDKSPIEHLENLDSIERINGRYDPNDFPKIELSIKNGRLKAIDKLRLAALKANDFSATRKWFKAKIKHKVGNLKAKIRLKGDLQDHYDTDRFSLRVKYKHDQVKTVLSLQHPKTRKYISEWIFHQLLKQEGMHYLNYEFVTVIINDSVKGLYALEEHLTNHGIEKKWNRPAGPIISFDDSGFWAGGLDTVDRNLQYDTRAYMDAKIRVYNYDEHDGMAQTAIELLDAYRNGHLPSDSVFNMEMLGKFYALCDLSGARHGLRWLNCRYYYNPIQKRLEPIGFDSNSIQVKTLVYFDNYLNEAHHGGIKHSQTFIEHYKNGLDKYKEKAFLDQFFQTHKTPLDLYISAIKITDSIDCDPYLDHYYCNQELMNKPLEKVGQ